MHIAEVVNYLNKDVQIKEESILKTGRKEIPIFITGLKIVDGQAIIIYEAVSTPKVIKPTIKKGK